jgi:glycerophosphoryl diester phosphodiesterase
MKKIYLKILLLLLISLVALEAKNLGHRLGGDVYSHENTLTCYKKALKYLQYKKDFKYVEFDIQETKDNKIVVFHDHEIKRIIPKNKHNRKVLKRVLKKKSFEKIQIKNLTLKEVRELSIAKNVSIPTLEEVLISSVKWRLKKPMHIEVKSLHSDKARYKLIELINKYSKNLDISIIAFRKYFYESFPFAPRWIKLFQENNIEASQIDKHFFTKEKSFCSSYENFTTLLPESSFYINKKNGRTQEFVFVLPKGIKCQDTIKIGIYGGSDDSGDKGVTFNLSNENGKKLLSGFSNSTPWEWFTLNPKGNKKLILTIEDMDTKFTGKHPGNGGMVKVLLDIK